MGAHYFGGYIEVDKYKHNCLKERRATWEQNISTIKETVGNYPQDSYATVVRAIQSEWIFIQCVTWDIKDTFARKEKMIRETFLPHLFFRKDKTPLTRNSRSEYNFVQ